MLSLLFLGVNFCELVVLNSPTTITPPNEYLLNCGIAVQDCVPMNQQKTSYPQILAFTNKKDYTVHDSGKEISMYFFLDICCRHK